MVHSYSVLSPLPCIHFFCHWVQVVILYLAVSNHCTAQTSQFSYTSCYLLEHKAIKPPLQLETSLSHPYDSHCIPRKASKCRDKVISSCGPMRAQWRYRTNQTQKLCSAWSLECEQHFCHVKLNCHAVKKKMLNKL